MKKLILTANINKLNIPENWSKEKPCIISLKSDYKYSKR